jgi:hypothetical protein
VQAVLLLLALSALPERMSISVSGDDRCDLAARLPQVMSRWLPGIAIDSGGLRLFVTASDDRLQVELQDEAGASVLEREIPRTACTADADAIALVVERYLRDLGWEPGEAAVRPPPVPTSTVTAPPPPPSPPIAIHFDLAASAMVELGLGDALVPNPRFAPALSARLEIAERFEIVLDAAYALPGTRSVEGSVEMKVEGPLVTAGGGACFALGPGRSCANVRGGIELLAAGLTGEPATRFDAKVPRPIIAGELRYDLMLSKLFTLFVAAGLFAHIDPPIFLVDGVEQYKPPTLTGALRIGGWVRIF